MILHHVFEDIECDVLESEAAHINNGWFEPHYHRELCEVDFDFDVDIAFKDFFDYIKPYGFENWKEDERFVYERAYRDVWHSSWFRLDDLEEDEDFIQFMKERYEDDARQQCQEDNE